MLPVLTEGEDSEWRLLGQLEKAPGKKGNSCLTSLCFPAQWSSTHPTSGGGAPKLLNTLLELWSRDQVKLEAMEAGVMGMAT